MHLNKVVAALAAKMAHVAWIASSTGLAGPLTDGAVPPLHEDAGPQVAGVEGMVTGQPIGVP